MINRVGKVKPSFTIVYIISLNVSMTLNATIASALMLRVAAIRGPKTLTGLYNDAAASAYTIWRTAFDIKDPFIGFLVIGVL